MPKHRTPAGLISNAVLLLLLVAASGGTAIWAFFSAPDRAAARPALPSFEVTACSTDPGDVAKLDRIQQSFFKFAAYLGWPAHLGEAEVPLAAGDVQILLGEAYMWSKSNTARMIENATEALVSLATYRSKLDKLGLEFDAMQRSAHFTTRRGVTSLIDAGLARIDGGISMLDQAGNHWEAAARAFLAYSYDTALAEVNSGAMTYGNGLGHEVEGGAGAVSSALNALDESSSCKTASDVGPPLSAAQINRSAGGGGTQRGGNRDLSVTAPKRLTLKKRGPTQLPITLQSSEQGSSLCAPAISPGCARIEIWLTRGKKLVLNIHGTAFKEDEFTLLLKVPYAPKRGNLNLRLTYIPPAGINPTKTINLTIRAA